MAPPTRLCHHYEVRDAKLLGQGRYGPVIRARDVRSKQLVAVKVFNAAEAFQSGKVPGLGSLAEARALVSKQFKHEVELLLQVHEPGRPAAAAGSAGDGAGWRLSSCSQVVVGLVDYSRDGSGMPEAANDGCCYLVLELGLFTLETLVRDSRQIGAHSSSIVVV